MRVPRSLGCDARAVAVKHLPVLPAGDADEVAFPTWSWRPGQSNGVQRATPSVAAVSGRPNRLSGNSARKAEGPDGNPHGSRYFISCRGENRECAALALAAPAERP